jgi:hypothetical protein
MAGTGKLDSLRLNRFETKRLAWALVLSLAAHFLAWGGYELGKQTGLWQRLHWPERKQLAVKKVPPPPVQTQEDPTMFLDVDTDQATPDAPKNAKYYSSKNSRAANPDASRDLNQPKLNGRQTDVPQTRDVPRTPNTKIQPMPEAQRTQEKQEALKSFLQAGDLKLAKLDTAPPKNETTPERPRTLKEARAQQQTSPLPSMAMQQEGGVTRRAHIVSLDSLETSFGQYDGALVDAITQYWYNLLDKSGYAYDRVGKVIVVFRLHSDGRVTDTHILEDTTNGTMGDIWAYMCETAVESAAPFAPWPSDMLHRQGSNYRDYRFEFNY